jgi:hypothetical protein
MFGHETRERQVVLDIYENVKFALIRKAQGEIFTEIKPWVEKNLVGCREVLKMAMTSDNGNITIAILYRV